MRSINGADGDGDGGGSLLDEKAEREAFQEAVQGQLLFFFCYSFFNDFILLSLFYVCVFILFYFYFCSHATTFLFLFSCFCVYICVFICIYFCFCIKGWRGSGGKVTIVREFERKSNETYGKNNTDNGSNTDHISSSSSSVSKNNTRENNSNTSKNTNNTNNQESSTQWKNPFTPMSDESLGASIDDSETEENNSVNKLMIVDNLSDKYDSKYDNKNDNINENKLENEYGNFDNKLDNNLLNNNLPVPKAIYQSRINYESSGTIKDKNSAFKSPQNEILVSKSAVSGLYNNNNYHQEGLDEAAEHEV